MTATEQRKRLRVFLAGSKCLSPASVYDPLSARVAESVGFEIGILSGSVVACTTLAAPDLVLQTPTEYADQIRRIMRVCTLSLFVDADNGYGNALNVMRTVQEFEHAGVSALAIEDTAGPLSFGQAEGTNALVSIEEGVGKMRAALAARTDPSLVIVARTPALKIEGIESMVARVKAYAATGVDGIHIAGGFQKLEQIKAAHTAAKLPVILGKASAFTREELAGCGVRLMIQGHQPMAAAVKTFRDLYTHLISGGSPADYEAKVASAQEMAEVMGTARYQQWTEEFMR
jgi:oxaloacetate decarboxylase